MNIFYVDRDPVKAAQMMCDKHIVKMILESAQMLCTAKRVLDGTPYEDKTKNGRKIKRWRLDNSNEEAIIYKAGWLRHPSTQWVMKSAYNYRWLYNHMMALNEEYKKRYNKNVDHVSVSKLKELLKEYEAWYTNKVKEFNDNVDGNIKITNLKKKTSIKRKKTKLKVKNLSTNI